VFPLRVNGQQGYVTELQQMPNYFISNIAGSLVAEVENIPQTAVIESYEVKWHTQTTQWCFYNLLIDEPKLAKQRVGFQLVNKLLNQRIFAWINVYLFCRITRTLDYTVQLAVLII
jgi:hypothetical protein